MPNKVSFITCSWSNFIVKRDFNEGTGDLVPGGLYFITDRNIIMHATAANSAAPYGKTVEVTDDLPISGVPGVLYIEIDSNNNYYGKVYDDATGDYVTVFAPASAPTASVASGQTGAVSGGTVHTYIHSTLGLDVATTAGGDGNGGRIVKLGSTGLIADSMLSTTTVAGTSHSGKLVKLNDTGKIDADMVPTTASGGNSNGGKIVKLDGNGKIADNMLPALAISSYITNNPSTYANLSTLTSAEEGDWTTVTDDATATNNGSYIKTDTGWQKLVDKYTTTNAVTTGSPALVTSGAVYTAIQNAALEWDNIPNS